MDEGGVCPPHTTLFKNQKVHHELNEGTSASDKMKKLQEEYIHKSRASVDLGFNDVFHVTIPHVKEVTHHLSCQDQIQELVHHNKAFSCSGIYQNMGSMLANSQDVTATMKLSLEAKESKEKYMEAYDKWKTVGEEKLALKDWREITMWVLVMESVPTPSKYNTKKSIIDKLDEFEWISYFSND